jgi:PhzF family phenazine biosynthesis protein
VEQSTAPWEGESVAHGRLLRLAAFSSHPQGGNPAGVWIGETLPRDDQMQRIAAEVGYSETAFIAPAHGVERTIRYFSPETEVTFCGHATIAAGVALGDAEGDGVYLLHTPVGEVPVAVATHDRLREASLTSVEPCFAAASPELVSEVLSMLGWSTGDLLRLLAHSPEHGTLCSESPRRSAWHNCTTTSTGSRRSCFARA